MFSGDSLLKRLFGKIDTENRKEDKAKVREKQEGKEINVERY